MKKVLVFATTFPTFKSGDATPSFVYELSKRLQKLGLQIIILTPRVPGSKKYEEKDGMKIYRYSYFFKDKWEKLNDGAILPNIKNNKLLFFQVPFLLLAGFINLIKIVKKEKINIIHAHWIIPQGFLAVLYKKFFNKKSKVICTSHGSDINSFNSFLGKIIKKYTINNLDYLTVVSNNLYNKCLKIGIKKEKISIIPMGVNINLFSPKNYDDSIKKKYNIKGKFLLFVGRLVEEKGIIYLIKAMKNIVLKYNKTKLVIIGKGPLENKLKKEVNKLKLEKFIIFIGNIMNDELPKYYATADVFIGPSIKEGLGLVFIESILSGTIVIGTKVGGIIDIIEDGKNGYIIKKENIKEIENKICEIIKKGDYNIDKYRKNIKNKFSWNIISEKYFNLINK